MGLRLVAQWINYQDLLILLIDLTEWSLLLIHILLELLLVLI
jgi:hypothetical protein